MKEKPTLKRTMIGDKEIAHLDVIHHNAIARFNFWERIKILIGMPVMIESKIFTLHEQCHVSAGATGYYVPALFAKKQSFTGGMGPMENKKLPEEITEDIIPMHAVKFSNEPEIKPKHKKGDHVHLFHKGTEHDGYIVHVNVDGSLDIVTIEHGTRYNDVWTMGEEKATPELYYMTIE